MLLSPQILARRPKQTSAAATFPSLTTLVARYMADTGVTTSGGNVTAVADQSGNNYHLVNNGTVPLNATSSYNSKPAFDFTAANDAALYTPDDGSGSIVDVSASASLFSVFMVGQMKTNTVSSGRAVILAHGGVNDYLSAGNILSILRTTNTNSFETYSPTGPTLVDDAISLATNHRLGMIADGTNLTHYINNSVASSAVVTLAVTSKTNIILGNQWAGTVTSPAPSTSFQGAAWDGPILEVVICNAALSGTERNNLDAYFTGRYGA